MNSGKIAIIGIGGRTGAMSAFELKNKADVVGFGKEKEVEAIVKKKFYIKRGAEPPELFKVKALKDIEFHGGFLPGIIFLMTKNPVGPAVEYYYQKLRNEKNLPALVLSQNGLSVGQEAKKALEKVLGDRAKEVKIIRVSLFNAVAKEEAENKIYISYSLPIRLCFGVFSGPSETAELKTIFKEAGIEAEEISSERIRDMEFSKLFANLIGMASASKGISLRQGFNEKKTFKEEIEALREYRKVVRAAGGNFLNLSHFPIKLFSFLLSAVPMPVLILFRKKIWKIVSRGRSGKEKGNLDEIDYYQGEVVKLGKELGIKTPINEEILSRVKGKM